MDINALGQKGLGLIHELMYLNIPDEIFCEIAEFLSSTRYFEFEWLLHDSDLNTVIHHAKECRKSDAILKELNQPGRYFIVPLDTEDSFKFRDVLFFFSDANRALVPPAQVRSLFTKVFTAVERALPEVDIAEEFSLSNSSSPFYRTVEVFLRNGNWAAMTRFPKLLQAFFSYAETLLDKDLENQHFYLTFVLCLAHECIQRKVDTQGKAEAIYLKLETFFEAKIKQLRGVEPSLNEEQQKLVLLCYTHLPPNIRTDLSSVQLQVKKDFSEISPLSGLRLVEKFMKDCMDEIIMIFGDELFFHICCLSFFKSFDIVVSLLKRGENPFLTSNLYDYMLPVELVSDNILLSKKEAERLIKLLEYRMGITAENCTAFRGSELAFVMTVEDFAKLEKERQDVLLAGASLELKKERDAELFAEIEDFVDDAGWNPEDRHPSIQRLMDNDERRKLKRETKTLNHFENLYGIKLSHLLAWPVVLVESLLQNSEAIKILLSLSNMSFMDLYNLDPRADKPMLRKWLEECKDENSHTSLITQISDAKEFKLFAYEMALYRTSQDTRHTFFATIPRNLACEIVAAKPKPSCLSYSEKILFADSMIPKTKQ